MEERLPPPPGATTCSNGTYVIRIPKDQVYRVPPPENAEIVNRNRQHASTIAASKGRQSRCVCWFFTIVLIIGFLGALGFCIWRFSLDPQPMAFNTSHVGVKQSAISKKHNLPPGFQITLNSLNPNPMNDITVDEGKATLKFHNKEIAKGRYPGMDHNAGKIKTVEVVLIGSARGGLVKEIEKATDPKRQSKNPVKLRLEMEIPIEMITWLFKKRETVKYGCDLEMSSLTEDAKLLSDRCRRL